MSDRLLAVLLAGGRGKRLEPLTRDRAKPAVPFGGDYRIIDFPLSNCINSGIRRVLILTQYKSRSLDRHIQLGWNFLSRSLGEFVDVLPPEQRIDEHWYKGTADALYQNIYSIENEHPDDILILAGDHIYKMDYAEMVRFHREHHADLTIGCIPVPLEQSRHFGAIQTDAQERVTSFVEKPPTATPLADMPDRFLASMGIYVFTARVLYELLCADAVHPNSSHDFGKDVIPAMIGSQRVHAFRFRDRNRKETPYWRDVGTLDSYYQANMDLVSVDPLLNLYDQDWPIRTYHPQLPPPKFVHGEEALGQHARRGEAINSLVCQGSIVSGGHVYHSILAPNVRINSFAWVEDSILLEGVNIGRNCRVQKAIIDKGVFLPAGTRLGVDREEDRRRGLTVTEQGIVVVPKGELPETFLK